MPPEEKGLIQLAKELLKSLERLKDELKIIIFLFIIFLLFLLFIVKIMAGESSAFCVIIAVVVAGLGFLALGRVLKYFMRISEIKNRNVETSKRRFEDIHSEWDKPYGFGQPNGANNRDKNNSELT